jgi:uncharacterized protein (TIGR04222 family)
MNPFDLPGPQFLAFYALFGAATLAVVYQTRQWSEAGEPGRVPVSDPYAIAYLRGGPTEAVRLGITVLIDRQLLDVTDDTAEIRKGVKPAHGVNEIERGILEETERAKPVLDLATSARLQALARKSCVPELMRLGLIVTPEVMSRRQTRVVVAVAVLLTVAAIKVAVGLSRNRPVSFLVLSAIVFSVATFFFVRGLRTSRGDRVLDDLRTLFDALRGRAEDLRPNASTSELALLMAVFGLEAVSVYQFPFVKAFRRPQPVGATNSCGGSSCGGSTSSCGSSSGSSCGGGGSSCGGGGGCGGCGGS